MWVQQGTQKKKTAFDTQKLIMSSYYVPEGANAFVLFATLPVTVTSAERSLWKL